MSNQTPANKLITANAVNSELPDDMPILDDEITLFESHMLDILFQLNEHV